MSQPAFNSGVVRATILVLFSFVFILIVGCSREVVTSSSQAARSDSDAGNDPFQPAIADVAFIDSSDAWAIDRSGTALYHVENGASLRKHATDFGSKPLISFVDRNTGFVFAHSVERGRLWRTTEGLEVPQSFASVVRNPNAPKWHGVVLHTKDGGKTWNRAPMPTDAAFHRVSFSDSKHGWLLGTDRLYRTVDGGLTWTTALEASNNSTRLQ